MKTVKDNPISISEILLNTLELVADLDVNNPNLMKELAKAKVVAEISDKAIKQNMYRLALRNFNRTLTVEPKPLKLLS